MRDPPGRAHILREASRPRNNTAAPGRQIETDFHSTAGTPASAPLFRPVHAGAMAVATSAAAAVVAGEVAKQGTDKGRAVGVAAPTSGQCMDTLEGQVPSGGGGGH